MRIIGIDPGLTRCGIGVVTLNGTRNVEFEHVEVLRSPADLELPARLVLLGESLERIFDRAPLDAVAIERVFAQQNLPSVMGVAQITGIAMFLAARRGIPVTQYTPNEVKAQVTGYGAADKAQVTTMVTRHLRLGAPPKPADAADALALAITHAWASRPALVQQRGNAEPGRSRTLTPAQAQWAEAERLAQRKR